MVVIWKAVFYTSTRPDLTIEVTLPLDITKEEANRLADFVRSIPF